MKKNVLSFLLVSIFMILYGFSLWSYEFSNYDSDTGIYYSIESDYEYSDINVEIQGFDNNLYGIYVENNSDKIVFIDPDSCIYGFDSEGNKIGDTINLVYEPLKIAYEEYWPYTDYADNGTTYACYLILKDDRGISYSWNIYFKFSDDKFYFDYDVDTNYYSDDIQVYAEDMGNYIYNVYLVNNSTDPIYIGTDSALYYCNEDYAPLYDVDTLADELVQIVPGSYYKYTNISEAGEIYACEFIVLDGFDGESYYWDLFIEY